MKPVHVNVRNYFFWLATRATSAGMGIRIFTQELFGFFLFLIVILLLIVIYSDETSEERLRLGL